MVFICSEMEFDTLPVSPITLESSRIGDIPPNVATLVSVRGEMQWAALLPCYDIAPGWDTGYCGLTLD